MSKVTGIHRASLTAVAYSGSRVPRATEHGDEWAEPASLSRRSVRQRGLIAAVQVLALAVWFSASAVVPTLQRDWGITAAEAVWLTASVQIGFVVGAVTSAFTNLADRVRPQVLLALGAGGAAACTAFLSLFATDLAAAIPLRFLTGICLAAVYPVGMKLMASWAVPAHRGGSFGILLGALTLGSALPHLIGVLSMPWQDVMLIAAGTTFVGALLSIVGIRPGPYLDTRRTKPNHRFVLQMFRDRRQLQVNLGYFGHMWELYAMWTWLPSFALASMRDQSGATANLVALGLFVAIGVAGVVGCLIGGWSSDRFGRSRTAIIALAVSGACCLLSPVVFPLGWVAMLVFGSIWGASVIADSGVFSTLVSEITDSHYVGTALTAQTAIGFLLTVVTIQVVPLLAAVVTWQYAFLLLVPGPLIGLVAMLAFGKIHPAKRQEIPS